MPQSDDLLTLSQAAKIAPGRPSSNCLWRWCRRGVSTRAGERVFLRHLRVGGRICTSAAWLEEFGRALAGADAEYFRLKEEAMPPPARTSLRRVRRDRFERHRRDSVQNANQELEDAGL